MDHGYNNSSTPYVKRDGYRQGPRGTLHVSMRKTTEKERKKWHGGPAPAILPETDKNWRPRSIHF